MKDQLFSDHDMSVLRSMEKHKGIQLTAQEKLDELATDEEIKLRRAIAASVEGADQFFADYEMNINGEQMAGEQFGHYVLHKLMAGYSRGGHDGMVREASNITAGIINHIESVAEMKVSA